MQQQKFIMDIAIDMTNCIRNQHIEDIVVNLIQQWKKECQVTEGTSKSHKSDMMSAKLIKTKKQKNIKIPKNQEKRKTINKKKLKQKQNQEENLQNKQKDQQITEVKKKETMTKPKIFNLSNKVLSQ